MAEALRIVNREPPDLIVLDLLLAWISGVEVLSTIRGTARFKRIPVLVITATATGAFELRAFAPVVVMHKPLDLARILPTVQHLLSVF